jgi:ABC-2 type transport system permease protein
MNLRRTRAVAKKEFLHILRDPRSLAMALAVPLVMLLLFGYGLTLDVDQIPTLVYDSDKTPESRELIARFQGSRFFQILDYVNEYHTIEKRIDQDQCLLAVVVPQG